MATLIYDPSVIDWLVFGVALGIAILKQTTGPIDEASVSGGAEVVLTATEFGICNTLMKT